MQACLKTPLVEEVRVVVRRTLGRTHRGLQEFLHTDYLDYAEVTQAFRMVDACLFCLGTSVTQVNKQEFVKISHDYPVAAAKTLKQERFYRGNSFAAVPSAHQQIVACRHVTGTENINKVNIGVCKLSQRGMDDTGGGVRLQSCRADLSAAQIQQTCEFGSRI